MRTRFKILISIIGFLVIQEVALRTLFPLPELSNFDRALFVPKKNELQGGFVRNKSFVWWSKPDTSVAFRLNYNMYGFRDKDWTTTESKGKQRVMLVGDSFVEGIMAEESQTIPTYFMQASSDSVETMNMGMLGTGLSEYLQLIADAVPIFRPDMVVMIIYANDFTNQPIKIPSHNLEEEYYPASMPRIIGLLQQYKSGNPVPSRLMNSSRTVLPDSSQSTYPFKSRIAEMYEHADSSLVSHMLRAEFNPYKLNEIMRMERALREPSNTLVALDFFRYYSEKFDFVPIVVFIPCRHQITNHYLNYEYQLSQRFSRTISLTDSVYFTNVAVLRQNCQQLGLKFIDSSDTLAAMESGGIRAYWNYDDHMRAQGYRAIGELIAKHH